MKKRTIINEDQFLFGQGESMRKNTHSTFNNKISEVDDEIVEFYLNDTFANKLNMSKESAQFVNNIIKHLMSHYDINYEQLSFGGSRDSVIYFIGNLMDQYLRYRVLKSLRNRDDEFVF